MGYYNGFDGFSLMSSLFPIFFITIFCIIIGMIIYSIVQYAQDKNKPIQTERVKVVAKRTNVNHHHHNHDGHIHHSTSTTYYVTFEFITGQRMELKVPRNKVGYIVEGDEGLLQFQGRLFVSFEVAEPLSLDK